MSAATFTGADALCAAPAELQGFVSPSCQQKFEVGKIVGPNPYSTGGFTPPSTMRLKHIKKMWFSDLNGNRLWSFDVTGNKILIYTALGTEAVDSTDQSGVSADVIALGTEL